MEKTTVTNYIPYQSTYHKPAKPEEIDFVESNAAEWMTEAKKKGLSQGQQERFLHKIRELSGTLLYSIQWASDQGFSQQIQAEDVRWAVINFNRDAARYLQECEEFNQQRMAAFQASERIVANIAGAAVDFTYTKPPQTAYSGNIVQQYGNALQRGVSLGVEDTVKAFAHPIKNIIQPAAALTYDVMTVVKYGDACSKESSQPRTTECGHYDGAHAALKQRGQNMRAAAALAEHILTTASGPERVEEGARIAVQFFVPGAVFKSLKYAGLGGVNANLQRDFTKNQSVSPSDETLGN